MNTTQQPYLLQDRGTQSDYQQYLSAMDAIAVEKVASASVFYDPSPGNTIVDVGMASGTSSIILAHLFPQSTIIGVDINPIMVEIARQTYQQSNLEFRIDDGEKLTSFDKDSIHGFFNCSSIHHITSFNGYDQFRAYNTLKRQADLLKSGGILVVRDFVKLPQTEVILDVSSVSEQGLPSDADLLMNFANHARKLASPDERGFPLKELSSPQKEIRRFSLFYSDAAEFIRRKDYYSDWEVELQEEYGYFTQDQFDEVFRNLGLRIIVSNPVYNPWIIRNRYRGKFTLYSKNGRDIGFPPTNYLIAGEKVNGKATRVNCIRHLPSSQSPFLNYTVYQDAETGKLFDLVQRPNSVIDILPYHLKENSIEILAKKGYPRPIITVPTDSPVIDQKHYSGYITEGITASGVKPVETILAERVGLDKTVIRDIGKSLDYFTSPGGIDEKVESVVVNLSEAPSDEYYPEHSVSGFADTGSIQKFDAVQLLKTSQTGALVEARLELNLYNLLRRNRRPFPPWFGEKIEPLDTLADGVSLKELLKRKGHEFSPVVKENSYLEKRRVKFSEEGVRDSNEILEYVIPNTFSINTLITLPVIRNKGEYYIGLEERDLPVPAIHTNNSSILVAPACRLPREISCFKELEDFIMQMDLFGTTIVRFSRLGEKFFPSAGVTPEQVYPYAVTVSETSDRLKWVNLTELFDNMELLRDGHLLICIMRLINALYY
jgi:ubiquinone/menaquinone biosynthesis C-methylase UbiE